MDTTNAFEWTREQKEEMVNQRMREMEIKNEKYRRRYAEVEEDRIAAESKNSAVIRTTKPLNKEKNIDIPNTTSSREWDKGKPAKAYWKSPNHNSSYVNYRSGHNDRERRSSWGKYSGKDRDDHWNDKPSSGYYDRRLGRKDSWSGRKAESNYRHKDTTRSHSSPKRKRTNYRSGDTYRKTQYSDEKYKKSSDSNRANLRRKYSTRTPSSRSESDNNLGNYGKLKASAVWESERINGDENKHEIVENWVKSVNKSSLWNDKKSKPYSKFDRFKNTSSDSSESDDEKCPRHGTPVKKCENIGTFPSSPVPKFGQSEEHKRCIKNKRGPQLSSAANNPDHQRKQMRYEPQVFKNKKEGKSASSWNNFVREKKNAVHRKSNFHGKNPKLDEDISQGAVKQSNDNDGWGDCLVLNASSNIEWNLSDDERDTKQESSKPKAVIKSTWHNNNNNDFSSLENSSHQKNIPAKSCRNKENNEDAASGGDTNGIWDDIDQSNVKWNLPEEEALSKVDSGLEDNSNEDEAYKKNMDEIAFIMEEKCRINVDVISDDERNKSGSQDESEGFPNVNKDENPSGEHGKDN